MFAKEPTIVINALTEVVRAVIPMLLVFGLIKWTDQQLGAVMLVVGVVAASLATILTRQQVVPTELANQQIRVAVRSPEGTSVEQVKAKVEAQNA